MREVIASAPGKINLVLRSGKPGADGYHALLTVFEAVSLRETVVARTRRSPGIGVETLVYRPGSIPSLDEGATRALAGLPEDSHLAVKAARALAPLVAAKWGPSAAGLQLTVHKTVPVAGGMAGGSADAAATLVAVNELWELGLPPTQLEALGQTLGADVPACLRGGWSVGEGRGDVLTDLPVRGEPARHWWALAFFGEGLSTPAVFKEFDALDLGEENLEPAENIVENASIYTGPDLAGHLENDLAAVAAKMRPELAEVGNFAVSRGALAWTISGSGPTVAALARNQQEAQAISSAWLEAEGPCAKISGTTIAWGADEGARVEKTLPSWLSGAH